MYRGFFFVSSLAVNLGFPISLTSPCNQAFITMSAEVMEGTVVNIEPQKEAPADPPIEDAKSVGPPPEGSKVVDPPLENAKAVVQKNEPPKAETKPAESGMNGK